MISFPNFEYYYKKDSKVLDIILQGGDVGIDKPFIRSLIDALKSTDHSLLAFNFLYYERGEDHSSGKELKEEIDTLKGLMDFIYAEKFNHIRLIGKSLGGIVASFFLDKLPAKEQKKFSVVILGYVASSVRLQNFTGPVTIIQGEIDKFGNIKTVKNYLKDAKSKNIKYIEISKADHSFRDPETKEPIYVDKVLKIVSSL